jgi:hypothetical protein
MIAPSDHAVHFIIQEKPMAAYLILLALLA